jgi:hypothetical protein
LNEFTEALSGINAVRQFVMNLENSELDLPDQQPMALKLSRYAERLWIKRSPGGKSPLETLNYLVWGSGESHEARIWKASRDDLWKLPWMRVSTLGDILGWARPDNFTPINGRTVKALRALGYDVSDVAVR